MIEFIADAALTGGVLICADAAKLLDALPMEPVFDLVLTSPPYNLGKEYEKQVPLADYFRWQEQIIGKIVPRLKDTGSLCWQVGSYVNHGEVYPLDIGFAPIFSGLGLKLRNRIVWHYGHGLHCKRRFSGRYEVVLWYTKSDRYIFDLDAVRVPSKYPGKRHFKGAKKGQPSGNPLGKNPEDVWDIPNVKSNHVEKTTHPCQFPVGLAERLVLALTGEGQLVFDPFSGAATTGVAALLHNRRFLGCEIKPEYSAIGRERLAQAANGTIRYRPFDQPILDPAGQSQSRFPEEWSEKPR